MGTHMLPPATQWVTPTATLIARMMQTWYLTQYVPTSPCCRRQRVGMHSLAPKCKDDLALWWLDGVRWWKRHRLRACSSRSVVHWCVLVLWSGMVEVPLEVLLGSGHGQYLQIPLSEVPVGLNSLSNSLEVCSTLSLGWRLEAEFAPTKGARIILKVVVAGENSA